MPRTIAVAPDRFAKSAVSPEKLSTISVQPSVSTDGRISRIIAQRSSTENIGLFSALLSTATTISSKSGDERLIMSRCPFVNGSNDPGKMALRKFVVKMYAQSNYNV